MVELADVMMKVRRKKSGKLKRLNRAIWLDHRKRDRLLPSHYSGNLKCARCGRSDKLTAHHKIPVCDGGTNHPDNIIPLCTICHDAEHGRRHR